MTRFFEYISFRYLYVCIVCMLGGYVTVSSVYAVVGVGNDCNAFSSVDQSAYADQVYSAISKDDSVSSLRIFTKQDLKIAMRHIQQACCAQGKSSKNDCSPLQGLPTHYADSVFLIDHLISIGMRKLDGVQEYCDVLRISCDMVDPGIRAVQRREKITAIAEDRKGHAPAEIDGLFREYRGDKQSLLDDDTLLANAYYIMCQEVGVVKDAVTGQNAKAVDTGLRTDASIDGMCKRMALDRYEQEANYVRTLMVEKGIEYLTQNLRTYSIDYLTMNRFNSLADTYMSLEGCFSTVLKAATNTSCCNEG